MISTRHKFIFLHVRKTGGNAVQSYLLPHSDDRKVLFRHQDGVDRFEIRGSITPTKHATLQNYSDMLGSHLEEFAVILPIRDPLDRALSLYFSPHRAFGQPPGFRLAYDQSQFETLLQQMPSMTDYLRVAGGVRKPAFLLRFDNLTADLAGVADHFGLPAPQLPLLNCSLDQAGERERLKSDPWIAAEVRRRFAEDYAYFGF